MIDDFPSISRNWGDMPHEIDSVGAFGAIANRVDGLTERDATTTFIAVLSNLSFCDHDFGRDHTEERHRGTGHAQDADILRTFCRPLNR
jgi:hypothetical protein